MQSFFISFTVFVLITGTAKASCDISVEEYDGYTISAGKTITGYVNTDGKRGDDFQGCDYGRIIVLEGNVGLKCQGYSYHYAYRPRATFLVNGYSIKMCVDGSIYDMGKIN